MLMVMLRTIIIVINGTLSINALKEKVFTQVYVFTPNRPFKHVMGEIKSQLVLLLNP